MKIKITLLLMFASVMLCTSQVQAPPEKKYTVALTMQDWSSIVQTIKSSNIPMDRGIAIITAFNEQIEQQLKDTLPKKEKR